MAVKVNSSGNTVNEIKVNSGGTTRNVTIGRVNVGGVTRIFFPDGDLESDTAPVITNPNSPYDAITSDNRIGPASATTLSVSNGTWTVNNVTVTPTSFVYAWKRNGISVGGNFNTYTPDILDRNGTITCNVTATYQGKTASADSSNSVDVATLPGTPSLPTLTRGTRQITVNWAVVSSGGIPLDYYVVRYRESGTSSWTSVFINVGTTAFTNREYTISSLSDNTTYEVQVAAANTEGQGDYSNTASASTYGVPVNTVAPTISPTSFTAGVTTLTGNRGSWSSDLTINTYRYIWRYSSTSSFISSTIFADQTRDPSQSSTVTTPDLPGYYIRLTVVATNAVGDSSPTNSIVYGPIAVPPPSTPTNFQATGACNSISCTWGQSTYANGYEILYSTSAVNIDNNIGNTATFGGGSTTSGTISNLSFGSYYLKIRAYNINGIYSSYSSRIGPISVSSQPSTPSAPTTSTGCGTITISWSAPSSNGSTITQYVLRRTRSDGSITDTTISSGTTAFINRSVTQTLSTAYSYTFSVNATNSCGTSNFSSNSSSVTPGSAPVNISSPTISEPSPPTKPGDTLTGSVGSWQNSPTSFQYAWQYSLDQSSWFLIDNQTSTSYTVGSLFNNSVLSGGKYVRFRTRAANDCGATFAFSSPGVLIRCGNISSASRGSSVFCSSTQRAYDFSWTTSAGATAYYFEIRRTNNNTLVDSGVVSGTSVRSVCLSTSSTIAWSFSVRGIPGTIYNSSNSANGVIRTITGNGW